MRSYYFSIILLVGTFGSNLEAISAEVLEQQCRDIGFKQASKAFKECVSELASRGALDSSPESAQCTKIGFKPMTKAFQECVDELSSRSQQQSNEIASIPPDALSGDDLTCANYGFSRATVEFSNCKQTIAQAKADAVQRQAAYDLELKRYEAERREYDQKLARYEEQQRQAEKQKIIRFGLALMGGQSPSFAENLNSANRDMLGLPPQPPRGPISRDFTIRNPGGNTVNCNVFGSIVRCR
ncbi:MAG: hypothetical protein QUV35_15320 [Hydrogenophaga sp.]|uniref:hypothetical protein n=1 Tax=Hydrogenophaga sp. TaxID=1904254 RepID=UPI0026394139|nr:hypothetical protein [Hydrogenophaga sp.]MDM7943993.1 hypothetical protein [Hydrogenophaga sp.]